MAKFKIEIILTFLNEQKWKSSQNVVDKDYIYYNYENSEGENKNCTDQFKFERHCREEKMKITISGKRNSSIKFDEFLFTKKSVIYRECISALLYVYCRWGSFEIKEISCGNQLKSEKDYHVDVEKIHQKFNKDFKDESGHVLQAGLTEDTLNDLFDYRNNKVFIPLMHLIEGVNYIDYRLEHSWKAFNSMYNQISQSQSDKDSYKRVIEIMSKNYSTFKPCCEAAKEIVQKNISVDEMISFICKNKPSLLSNIEGFYDILEASKIENVGLLKYLKYIYGYIYKGDLSKEDAEKKRKVKQKFENRIMEIGKNDKNSENSQNEENIDKEKVSDYLKLLIDYIGYLRNKSMHGVFLSPSFLFLNDATKELERYSVFLTKLCMALLRENIYDLS